MSWCIYKIKEYKKHMENFDQNVDHISNWIIRAEKLLDESEKKKPQQGEDVLKVANNILWKVIFKWVMSVFLILRITRASK